MSWSWTVGKSMPGDLRIQCLTQRTLQGKGDQGQNYAKSGSCQTLSLGEPWGSEERFGLSFRHTSPKS